METLSHSINWVSSVTFKSGSADIKANQEVLLFVSASMILKMGFPCSTGGKFEREFFERPKKELRKNRNSLRLKKM